MNNIEKIEQATTILQVKLDWIGRHDTRIAFVAGVAIAMLGILANASASIVSWNCLLYIIFGLAAILLFISLILIYLSQYPKTKSQNSSLVFFGTIASLKLDQFKKNFKAMTDDEYLDDLLSQVYINSEILAKKFTYLKSSLIFLVISVIPWLGAIYLSKIYLK
jgi:hypothetical protein